MSHWIIAGLWGLFSGSSLVVGSLIGYYIKLSPRKIAIIMGFGAGVLISALSFELMEEAFKQSGLWASSFGFISGALIYFVANFILEKLGAKHRKRSRQQPSEEENEGSGLAIAMGALLDGIPESMAIGISMLGGGTISLATVIAIFISNLPEGLSSSSGMKNAGRSKKFIFGIWGGIAIISGIAAILGYTVFGQLSATITGTTLAVAAGAILNMVSATMIPEAFDKGHNLIGIVTVLGFLGSFLLSHLA
ncbi:ZIP family zinc transporter [Christiangramia fulva]|uniref:ZIP family zinc transporter n=1 Tax=Christiangramia fulva TaxID=2126553 RepID=A0A2R3Z7K3_9FLAO|nr:ZIP family zinc transporter [Christiangramia fulva]AVR46260.1 ZIP family zinc transporter [Christiangramia fulva]